MSGDRRAFHCFLCQRADQQVVLENWDYSKGPMNVFFARLPISWLFTFVYNLFPLPYGLYGRQLRYLHCLIYPARENPFYSSKYLGDNSAVDSINSPKICRNVLTNYASQRVWFLADWIFLVYVKRFLVGCESQMIWPALRACGVLCADGRPLFPCTCTFRWLISTLGEGAFFAHCWCVVRCLSDGLLCVWACAGIHYKATETEWSETAFIDHVPHTRLM